MNTLRITPRDPLIIRDGRPFGIDEGNRMKCRDWLTPSVVAGSFRTIIGKASGCDFNDDYAIKRLKEISLAGPFPFRNNDLCFPSPSDAFYCLQDKKLALLPFRPTALEKDEGCDLPEGGLRPVMLPPGVNLNFKPNDPPIFCSKDIMVRWLIHPHEEFLIDLFDGDDTETSDLLWDIPKETRFHFKIDPETGVPELSGFFSTTGIVLSHPILSRVNLASFENVVSKFPTLHPIGAERRLASWDLTETQFNIENPGIWDPPRDILRVIQPDTQQVRLILVTPAIFEQGWRPGWLGIHNGKLSGTPPGLPEGSLELALVGAALDRWEPISGWSYQERRQKPLRRMVPAGAVYFFEVTKGDPSILVDKLWLQSVCDRDADQREGFGVGIWGIW